MQARSHTSRRGERRVRDDGAVPPGAPAWVTAELIERTLKVWQPYYRERLTPEDAVTIVCNAGRLFRVLSRE